MIKKIFAIICFCMFFINYTEAKYTQTCVVSYMTKDGWSKKYTVDVSFYTGYELNEKTQTIKYSHYSVYAIIFWGEGQATIIKLSSINNCGSITNKQCITNYPFDFQGFDQDDDEWKICTRDYCIF